MSSRLAVWLLLSLLCVACVQSRHSSPPSAWHDAVTLRQVSLDERAWAGSSVNVLGGVRQTLFTDGITQYAGYYDADATLVLAKRRLGDDVWQHQRTRFTGHVDDAHNHISLVVDGSGRLHVAWDHHNSPLRYAVAASPDSLDVSQVPMLGVNESSVTYPQFYRLPDGDVLFQYRDGGSGNGRLVLNRFDHLNGTWQRLHDNVLDGQGQRNAYWDMYVDRRGGLHLAWNWRESPDVATNHDLYYLHSGDGGQSWQTEAGKAVSLPVRADSLAPVVDIPQQHNLMNPPVVAADHFGRPYLASYWSAEADAVPAWQVWHFRDGGWNAYVVPPQHEHFRLQGHGTRRPPISRAALLVESSWHDSWFHLLYRDDAHGLLVASATELGAQEPQWQWTRLPAGELGGWEPSYDPQLWMRMGQWQALAQSVQQQDGVDQNAPRHAAPINLLIWSPNWERHQVMSPSPTRKVAPPGIELPSRASVVEYASKVAHWQWAHQPPGWNYHPRAWAMAPLYIGSLMYAEQSQDSGLENTVWARAAANLWQPHDRVYDADDYVVSQAYLRLYLRHPQPEMLAPTLARLDDILANPAGTSMDWGSPGARDRWTWSDALYMGPMTWLLAWHITGDERYLDFMTQEWWATSERLYRDTLGLYFRDESYLDLREQNGATIHWARGIGWSFAGLAQVLQWLPEDHPQRALFMQQYKEMAAAFVAAQQDDGLWRPGLLDPQTHTARETSGSAFAMFALATGVAEGWLVTEHEREAALRGWHALCESVTASGKLREVQPIGAAPYGFDPENSEPFASGAFLMAASALLQWALPE